MAGDICGSRCPWQGPFVESGVWQRGMCVKGHAWRGTCMVGGMCGGGVHGGRHVWQGLFMAERDMCDTGHKNAGWQAGGSYSTGMQLFVNLVQITRSAKFYV